MNGLTKVLVLLALAITALHAEAVAGEKMPNLVQQTKPPVSAIAWLSDYGVAMRRAEAEKKMLFIYFQPAAPDANSTQFEQVGLEDTAVRQRLSQMVCLRTSVDARIKVGDQEMRLVDHAAFDELEHRRGPSCSTSPTPTRNTTAIWSVLCRSRPASTTGFTPRTWP